MVVGVATVTIIIRVRIIKRFTTFPIINTINTVGTVNQVDRIKLVTTVGGKDITEAGVTHHLVGLQYAADGWPHPPGGIVCLFWCALARLGLFGAVDDQGMEVGGLCSRPELVFETGIIHLR